MKAKQVCFFCVHKLWQVFAIGIVLLAILVSLLKYSLPYANDYRNEVETFLAQQFGVNISIGSLSASWQGNGPALIINDIGFEDNAQAPISLTVQQTRLHVNLWQSVLDRQLSSNYFVLKGFKAKVDARQLLNSNEQSSSSQQQALIESLFLGNNGHFAIEDSELNIVSLDNLTHRIYLENLVWQNRNNEHLAQGQVSLPGIDENTLEARVQFYGSTLADMYGDLYLQALNLDVAGWLEEYINDDLTALKTNINFESWLHFANGRLTDTQLQIHPSKLSWSNAQDEPQHLEFNDGGLRIHPHGKGWQVRTSGITISDETYQWEPLVFEGILGKQTQLWLKDTDVSMVSTFSRLAKSEQLKSLFTIAPKGFIEEGYVEYDKQNWRVWFNAQQLGWSGFHGIPGAQDLTAQANITNEKGLLTIQGTNNHLLTGDTFVEPLAYQTFDAQVDFFNTSKGWRIQSKEVALSNDDLTLVSEFSILLDDNPSINLYAEVSGGSAEHAGNYFPTPYMHPRLIEYLNGAIEQGQLDFAQVLLRGSLSEFPFSENQGRFIVDANIDQAQFAFAPDWPAIKNADVRLLFDNQRMDIYSLSGELLNLSLDDSVHVYLDDLLNADTLAIDIDTQVQANQLQPFFAGTPLAKPLGNVFEVIQGDGEIAGELGLRVDLKNGGVTSSGDVAFDGLPVYLTQPGIQLDALHGRLKFENDKITLADAKAQFHAMPLTINVLGQQKQDAYVTNINVQADADMERLHHLIDHQFADYVQGQTIVNADIDLRFDKNGFAYEADINSDLLGVQSTLPAPYAKQAKEVWPFSAIVQGDDISNLIMAEVDDKLYFNGILNNGAKQMSNAHLIVGEQDLGLTQKGFKVSVELDKTDVAQWQPLISDVIEFGSKQSTNEPVLPSLTRVVGQVRSASVGLIPFNDLSFVLTPQPQRVDIKLNAKELHGKVTIPLAEDARTQPVKIYADYLRLNIPEDEQLPTAQPQEQTEPAQHQTWLTELPNIEFECFDCRVNSYQLDHVSMLLAGNGEKLDISQLVVDKGDHVLRAGGVYTGGKTRFNGAFTSRDIGELFDEFDITSTVKDSKAEINFDLNWRAAPYAFDLPSLGGEIKWELGDGHLADISDGGARVFSLLSLDSLVRKLKLDFRDVFAKGFFYNDFTGSMQLADGVAYTKDTKMDGVPADLTISGYANLVDETINYDLSVAPQVTSSLPVIVAWMVNPVSGLAALALDQVIHSARVISEIQFKITGPISDPQVIELDRKSKEITIPQAAQAEPPQG